MKTLTAKPSLEQSQKAFAASLLNKIAADAQSSLQRQLADAGVNKVGVYQDNYQQALFNSLSDNFPLTRKLLGYLLPQEELKQILLSYIDQYPSQHWDINLYGENFCYFLAQNLNQLTTREKQLCCLLASIDYARLKAYYSKNGVNNLADLAQLTPEQQSHVCLVLAPELQLYQSCWRLDKVLDGLSTNSALELDQLYTAEAQAFVLYRRNFHARLDSIGEAMLVLLQQCQQSHSLESISQLEIGEQALAQVPKAIENGWIQAFELQAKGTYHD